MYLQHAGAIWRDFPELAAGAIYVEGIVGDSPVDAQVKEFTEIAASRLAGHQESELPEVQAWRRAFAAMGLKPTQYRCASEALLRRLRKEGSLPRLHPLIDLCNAVSVAFAIPVAALDVSEISGGIEVRYATGAEDYLTFGGEIEHPAAGEVVFADVADRAHARRWTNRQSGLSAVRDTTRAALIVAEALHEQAPRDVATLIETLARELAAIWPPDPSAAPLASATQPIPTAMLTPSAPRFVFDPRPEASAGA